MNIFRTHQVQTVNNIWTMAGELKQLVVQNEQLHDMYLTRGRLSQSGHTGLGT